MRAVRSPSLIAAFALAAVLAAVPARGQALKQLPGEPLFLIKINDPQNVSARFGELTARLGLAKIHPALADPLSFVQQAINAKAGVNVKGELVLAIYDAANGTDQRPLLLVPVSDYAAFVGNFEPKKDGQLEIIMLPDFPAPLYTAHWGDYAAMAVHRELVADKPQGLSIPGPIAKQLAERDVIFYANLKLIRGKALPDIRTQRAQLLDAQQRGALDAAANEETFQKAMQAQTLGLIEQFLEDGTGACLGLTIAKEGVSTTLMADFEENSPTARFLAEVKNTDANLVADLPDGKYLAAIGWVQGGPGLWSIMQDFVLPALRAVPLPEADSRAIQDEAEVGKKFMSAVQSGSMGFFVPPRGAALDGGVLRVVGAFRGDSKALLDLYRKFTDAENAAAKAMAVAAMGIIQKFNVTPDAKNVDGVSLTRVVMEIGAETTHPQAAEMQKVYEILYGKNPSGYVGAVGEGKMVFSLNADDEQVKATIAAAKAGQGALAANQTIGSIAQRLPKQRFAVAYISPAAIVTTVLESARELGAPVPPIKLAPDTPFMGIAAATEGTALRIDSHLPTDLIANVASAIMQVAISRAMDMR